jgi:hypothetical protein
VGAHPLGRGPLCVGAGGQIPLMRRTKTLRLRLRKQRFTLWRAYRQALSQSNLGRQLTQRRVTLWVLSHHSPSPLWFMYNWKYVT